MIEEKAQISIEQKEIRGVTGKVVWAVISSAAVIIVFLVSGYLQIIDAVKDSNTANTIQDIQIGMLRVQVDKQQLEIDRLKEDHGK